MLPNMSDVLSGLTSGMQFAVIGKAVNDFEVVETKADVEWFCANSQPIHPQDLLIKPEGQRIWKWLTIFTIKSLLLDWVIKDRCGKQYRVMSKSDWQEAGYFKYELIEQPI